MNSGLSNASARWRARPLLRQHAGACAGAMTVLEMPTCPKGSPAAVAAGPRVRLESLMAYVPLPPLVVRIGCFLSVGVVGLAVDSGLFRMRRLPARSRWWLQLLLLGGSIVL